MEPPEVLTRVTRIDKPKRTLSAEQASSIETHKSSFAGTRQPSEDSRNIRFAAGFEDRKQSHRRAGKNWQNVARRLSRPAIQGGLKNIRVRGHLNYTELRQRFERQSTFHGISHASLAPNTKWRWFWYTAFLICLAALLIQIIFLIIRYRQYHKTVDLDLKFENAPFPSITLCNLNPYKRSSINSNPDTKAMMDAYTKRLASGDKTEGVAAALNFGGSRMRRATRPRKKSRDKDRRYHQVFAQCLCDVDPMTAERKGSCFAALQGKVTVDISGPVLRNFHPSKCLCQLDMISRTLWPCFPYSSWKEKLCVECVDSSGHCPMRFHKSKQPYVQLKEKEKVDLCLCHKDYNHCVRTRDDGIILEIDPNDDLATLNATAKSEFQLMMREKYTTTTTTEAPALVEALGFDNITDDIALATQAQQNLMFAVGSMSSDAKQEMSHQLDEFILKCSFNQKDCDIERDFKLHYDNTYGNCYTFNHDRQAPRQSQRAGANYGLRVLLYADVTEYLPTSESVGFRITIHDKHIVPFPDAFGYSAPTGFQSSFGVRMKQFIRLEPPHGHCKAGGEDEPHYVYKGFQYSVEACHRSCAQKFIITQCGCGDPMFPMPQKTDSEPCKATNNVQRECLRNATLTIGEQVSKGKDEFAGCSCHQPCEETNYEVTYSAARWPSGSSKVMECTPGDFMCLEKYRKNAAMIQIFYEELNYETLQETPAYTMTSLMADLGGLTGLWIGASVVSLLELVALAIFFTQAWQHKRKGSIQSASNPQLSIRRSNNSLHQLHKTSTKLSVQDVRSIKSLHSSKSRSKQSILIEDVPPIQEQSDDVEEESSTESNMTASSCRYLAPGEDLPCLCKYDNAGRITVMKALCPCHGYMVRRQYDYSDEEGEEADDEELSLNMSIGFEGISNSEAEEGVDDEVHKEEPYYQQPFQRKQSSKKKKRPSQRGSKALSAEEDGNGPGPPTEGEGLL